MSYVHRDGHFWLTASGQRKRVAAIGRDGRVALAISSSGTQLGPGRTASYKGTARVVHDNASKAWFYPTLAERLVGNLGAQRAAEFAKFLDSLRRVIIEVTPDLRVGYDGSTTHAATRDARAAVSDQ